MIDVERIEEKGAKMYDVKTVSLIDLLERYDAPRHIDYLSLDTEGSEFDILEHFNFTKYEFRFISCEHNRTPNRHRIRALLEKNGYRLVSTPWGFEDWYTRHP